MPLLPMPAVDRQQLVITLAEGGVPGFAA
jgi:hypothetical protein